MKLSSAALAGAVRFCSRLGRRRLSPSRYLKAKVAGQVHESPYVRGFIKDEVQRKYRLFELNQKFKKMKK